MERHDPETLRHARRISRLVGALVGLIAGVFYGVYVVPNSEGVLSGRTSIASAALLISAAVGMVSGFILGPALSVEPFLWVEHFLDSATPPELFGGAVGLVLSLVVSALLAVPLNRIPDNIGLLISLAVTGVLVYIGTSAGMRRRTDLLAIAGHIGSGRVMSADNPGPAVGRAAANSATVVDTSVLIDGRVLEVAQAGFIPGTLLLPGFVLEELQRVADSGDPLRRAKGRRGLATVEGLQALDGVVCEVVDVDFPGVPEVDSRLVRLARARGASVMTTDYMLNRLAQIEGLRVLNLNDLALALKPIVSAGETMDVTVVKEGKELHQGVGYLDDGTMIVVENGRRHIDETVTVTVTSVLQTPAGRMIFAAAPSPAGNGAPAAGDEPRVRPARGQGGRATRIVKS